MGPVSHSTIRSTAPPGTAPAVAAVLLGRGAGFRLTETRYAPSALLATHHHDSATLSLVFGGGHEERVGRRAHECAAFSFVYKPPQISHSNRISHDGLHALFVEIDAERAAEAAELSLLMRDAVCVRSPAARGLVARVAQELRRRDAAFELSIEGLLLELWAVAARHRPPSLTRQVPPWLARAREFIHGHFRERVTLAEIARTAGVHPVHLAQVFRRRYGRSVGGYVRELRIEFACTALADPRRSIGRVGLEAGFADHGHFTRAFRARMGLTPSEYRRLVAAERPPPSDVQAP